MRQGSTSQRLEGEAETSLARGLLSMSRGNVGVTSPFVLPSPRMGSSSVMPIWALITQLTSSHFWTDCKTSSLQLTRCTRCNSLSSGTMFHSTALLWSRTGFNTINSLHFFTSHHTLHFLTLSRSFSRHGGGRCTISGSRLRYPSFRPWRRPVTKLTLWQYRDGFGIPDGSSHVVWPMRILPVMWMKFSGQIQLGGEMMHSSTVFSFFFFGTGYNVMFVR